jgi:hypothetical protein
MRESLLAMIDWFVTVERRSLSSKYNSAAPLESPVSLDLFPSSFPFP